MIIKCLPCLSLQKEGDCGQLKVFCPGNEVGTSSPCWCSKLGWQKLPLRHKPCPCPPAAGQVCRPRWAAQRPAPAPQPGCGCCSQLAPRGTKFNLSAISPANRPKINFDVKIRLQGKVQGRNKKKKTTTGREILMWGQRVQVWGLVKFGTEHLRNYCVFMWVNCVYL